MYLSAWKAALSSSAAVDRSWFRLVFKPLTTWACALFASLFSNLLLSPPCTLVYIATRRARAINTETTIRVIGLDIVMVFTLLANLFIRWKQAFSLHVKKDESPGCVVRIGYNLTTPLQLTIELYPILSD